MHSTFIEHLLTGRIFVLPPNLYLFGALITACKDCSGLGLAQTAQLAILRLATGFTTMDCELIMLPGSPYSARSQRRKDCRGLRLIAATMLWQDKPALLVSEPSPLAVKMTIKRRALAEDLLCQIAKGSADLNMTSLSTV